MPNKDLVSAKFNMTFIYLFPLESVPPSTIGVTLLVVRCCWAYLCNQGFCLMESGFLANVLSLGGEQGLSFVALMAGNRLSYPSAPGTLLFMVECFIWCIDFVFFDIAWFEFYLLHVFPKCVVLTTQKLGSNSSCTVVPRSIDLSCCIFVFTLLVFRPWQFRQFFVSVLV